MAIPILGDLVKSATDVILKLVPDADKKMDIAVTLQELADKVDERESTLLQGQIDVDKIEAANPNIFVSGWRPFIGWTSGVSLAYTWMLAPLIQFIFMQVENRTVSMPALPAESIYPIVTAMLGIAGMRTFEKVKGVS